MDGVSFVVQKAISQILVELTVSDCLSVTVTVQDERNCTRSMNNNG